MMSISCLKYRFTIFVAAVLFIVSLFCSTAFAHRVIIFAWLEGNTVHTISKFPGGRKVASGTVTVFDGQDNLLLEGKTNDVGEFSFPVPKISPLTLVLSAGPGHQGKWRLSEAEIKNAMDEDKDGVVSGDGKPSGGSDDLPAKPQPVAQAPPPKVGAAPPAAKMKTETIVSMVETVVRQSVAETLDQKLDRKLAPVMRQLADLQNKGPTANDIFGGIGYILGIFGIAAYIQSRRRQTGEKPL